ncbi:MAG: SusD/RagB family nutrient-binding outer membrane lipoprotein [Chitinophagaceae bacterium]|jgi:hypothetical protein|nr:SusD/RagB family nutrient-binding outer membrane lipoprotein [Chitinophagaceae bacterium]
MNRIKILFGIIGAGAILASCSKKALDNVNANVNNAPDVPAKFILTDAMTATAFNAVGGDANTYVSIYNEYEVGDYEQLYQAETRSGSATVSSTYDNLWQQIYQNIKNLKIAVAKTSPGGAEAGNDVSGGIARVLLAYNLGVLTDLFGDAPYSQVGILTASGTPEYMQPQIDKQQDLYKEINAQLDSAITLLQGTDGAGTGSIGAQDLIYGGDASLWTEAAYGLKARYLMHTLFVSTNKTADLNSIVSYTNKSFGSAAEEFVYNQYNGSNTYNPFDAYNESRPGDFALSLSLATKFQQLNDPRGNASFGDWDGSQLSIDDAVAEGAPNGTPNQGQTIYPLSIVNFAVTAPTELLSYHELLFLKAEALVRLGKTSDALPVLQAAIEDAFAGLNNAINIATPYYGFDTGPGLSTADADNYFTNYVTPRFKANPIQEVMLQKYLAFYGAAGESVESFNDYRRLLAMGENSFTGASFVTLANPLNAKKQYPLRFAYGASDVTTNNNIKTAYGNGQYVFTDPVWWAGGTH